MSFRVQTMATGLRDETRPRRFDLTMSRRTRRPASLATNCHQEDQEVERLQPRQDVELKELPPQCLCLQDHLQSSRQSEDAIAHQDHKASSAPQACRLEKDDGSAAQHHQQEEEEFQDNSRCFSLQELIEDEAVGGDVKDAATGGVEENAALPGVAEAAGGAEKRTEQVVRRRVIGIMRRYVKVRSIKPKRAPEAEKNAAPVC